MKIINIRLLFCTFWLSGCKFHQHKIVKSEMGVTNFYRKEKLGIRHDAVELKRRYRDIFAVIDDEVDQNLLRDVSRGKLGFVHTFWYEKKDLLKMKYGIDWRSPREMNPDMIFD